MRRLVRAGTSLIVLLTSTAVLAEQAPSLLDQAQAAEHAARPQEALRLYAAILASGPGSSLERIAQSRIDWIRERSTNGFEPLERLLALQALPETAVSAAQVRAFEQQIDGIPNGSLRTESRALAGRCWLDVLKDPVEAERSYRRWLQDPLPAASWREIATTGLVRARVMQGYTLDGLRILREAGFQKQEIYRLFEARLLRKIFDPIAMASLLVFGLLTCFLLLSRPVGAVLAGAFRPSDLLLTLYVLAVPCCLAARYDSSLGGKFTRLGLGLAAVVLGALIAGSAQRERAAPVALRRIVALSALLACLGAGFLVFDQSELLEGMLRWRGL